MTSRLAYRADIDGLRAIAVIGVVLFHAKLGWIPGGFVGVDVFFVISGYLITKIIVSFDGSIGRFLADFYERRIRRLVPPALPVLAFTTLYAWYLLPPAAMLEYAQSLVAYAVFGSNWFFLSIAGYFDGPSHFKPLLHTWSLSIEEQFYLLFPIPILLLRRFGTGAIAGLLGAVLVFSLGYGAYLVLSANTDTAFYNSFARFWEIALGGLLAVGAVRPPRSSYLRQVLGLVGIALISSSMLLYDNSIPFPGLSALVPTMGAALVILATDSLANRLLAWRPVVGLGLVSYAIYLWHWPIFVFIEYSMIGAGPWHFLAGAAFSLGLAALSYFVVERPIRGRRVFKSSNTLVLAFIVVFAICAGAGSAVWHFDGLPNRFPVAMEYAATLRKQLSEHSRERLRSVCWVGSNEDIQTTIQTCVHPTPGGSNVLIVGDSHAAHFYAAFVAAWPKVTVNLLATDSCALQPSDRPTCNDLTAWLDENSANSTLPYDRVIISARAGTTQLTQGLATFAKKISSRGVRTTVLGPIQYYRPGLPILYPTLAGPVGKEQMLDAFTRAVQPQQFEYDAYLREQFAGTAVQYISLLAVTCPSGPQSCRHLDDDGLPITLDDSHLTLASAKAIVDVIAPEIVP